MRGQRWAQRGLRFIKRPGCLRVRRSQRLPGSCVRRVICGVCDLSSQAALTTALGLLGGLLCHAALTAALTAAIVLRLLRLGLRRPCRSLCRILGSCGKRGPVLSRGPRARRGGGGGGGRRASLPRTSYFCRSASARRSQRSPVHALGRGRGHPALACTSTHL